MLQNRIARIVTGTSYDSADHPLSLKELGWLNIRNLITLDLGIFMFKVNKGTTPTPISDMFQKVQETHNYGTRFNVENNYYRMAVKKEITKTAISYSGPKLWSEIPRSIGEAHSLDILKRIFESFLQVKMTLSFLFEPFLLFI